MCISLFPFFCVFVLCCLFFFCDDHLFLWEQMWLQFLMTSLEDEEPFFRLMEFFSGSFSMDQCMYKAY